MAGKAPDGSRHDGLLLVFDSMEMTAKVIDGFSHSPLVCDNMTEYSDHFQKAWLHVLMAVVLLPAHDAAAVSRHLDKACSMLEQGSRAMTSRIRRQSSGLEEVCRCEGIVALCFDKLVRDLVNPYDNSCTV